MRSPPLERRLVPSSTRKFAGGSTWLSPSMSTQWPAVSTQPGRTTTAPHTNEKSLSPLPRYSSAPTNDVSPLAVWPPTTAPAGAASARLATRAAAASAARRTSVRVVGGRGGRPRLLGQRGDGQRAARG